MTKTLRRLVEQYKAIVREQAGIDFPQDPHAQLDMATEAVFRSWNTERAHIYRRREKIPHDLLMQYLSRLISAMLIFLA